MTGYKTVLGAQAKSLCVVFAGGGTGGHLFPAIAIASEIKKRHPDAEIVFIGTRNKIEARVVPTHGFGFKSIWISGFRRSFKVDNLLFPLKVVVAMLQSFFLLRKMKPHVVVGTGGYVCGPVVYAASFMDIPTLIQEQNSHPGVTTRLLARCVDEVHISFEATRKYLKRVDEVFLTGNPTRSDIGTVSRAEAVKFFDLREGRECLLVFGGSLGATSINNALEQELHGLMALGMDIIWQTGEKDFARISESVGRIMNEVPASRIIVRPFIDRMEYAYAACSLVVCRSGATTVSELGKAGVASILVPYPHAAADHQTENAKAMVDGGAAIMIRDHELQDLLVLTISNLIKDPNRLKAMATNATRLAKPEASGDLAEAVLKLAEGR